MIAVEHGANGTTNDKGSSVTFTKPTLNKV